mgnify:CR=1 FL=1
MVLWDDALSCSEGVRVRIKASSRFRVRVRFRVRARARVRVQGRVRVKAKVRQVELLEQQPCRLDRTLEHARVGDVEGVAARLQRTRRLVHLPRSGCAVPMSAAS